MKRRLVTFSSRAALLADALRSPLGLAVAALIGLLATPTSAFAGTARVDSFIAGRSSDTYRFVEYRATPGELNHLTASVDRMSGTDTATLTDSAGVTPGAGCQRPDPANASLVRCVLGGGKMTDFTYTAPQAFRIFLGDGSDTAKIEPTPGVAGFIDGGPGDDALTGGTGGALIDGEIPAPVTGNSFVGGPGDDTMTGGQNDDVFDEGGSSANGHDTMSGGRGIDGVSYTGRRGVVTADLAGDRDDGERGERDRIVGAEDLTGGKGNDDLTGNGRANTLSGEGGRDVLRGGAGADHLSGGPGPDSLLAGRGADEIDGGDGGDLIDTGSGPDLVFAAGGADRIRARDRSPDALWCGTGHDSARLDGLDYARFDCERLRRRGTPRMVLLEEEAGPLGGGNDFYSNLELGCPADFPAKRCPARVAITYHGKLYARGVARVGRGKRNSQVFVHFTRTGNREFAHVVGPIRAKAKVTTRLPGGRRVSLVRGVILRGFGGG